jgi:predicted PurR-regulated permease PerM
MSVGSYEEAKSGLNWSQVLPILFRTLVWGALLGILYLLRSFFLLIFLTFVFAYIQTSCVNRLEARIKNRPLRVTLVGIGLLAIVLSIGTFLFPRVKEQAKIFADKYPSYLQTLDKSLVKLSNDYPFINEILVAPSENNGNGENNSIAVDPKKSPSAHLLQQLFGLEDSSAGHAGVNIKKTMDTLRNIGAYLIALVSAFMLSLIFSFLIVLDLPDLSKRVKGLVDTKLRIIYLEVAGSIRDFALVLGRAMEAQVYIAILNTFLTILGVYMLGIGDKVAFIALIVFLCSFIPVAGVFISTLPICLVALQESGVGLMIGTVAMIIAIHFVETYILNPRIYGHHLRMNPVVVLIILTLGGKLFGVWGLVLGVPICNYIFGHAIRKVRPA